MSKSPRSKIDRRRALGALLGLAVGDALGTTLEFTRPEPAPFEPLLSGPHMEMTGGGPFDVAPGQVTDDMQMATCLAASLLALDRFDADDVARRYVEWKQLAFDIGRQTHASLLAVEQGTPARDAGRQTWEADPRRPAGNGALMRTAPIAIFFAADDGARRSAALADAAITHYDPRCRIACAAFNGAIAAAVRSSGSELSARREVVDAAREEVNAAAVLLATEGETLALEEARVALLRDLDLSLADDPELYGPELHLLEQQGFVRVAFRLAFWELVHAPDFRRGLLDVVNRGGDADTGGAIAGALLGAFHGQDAIPDRWVDRVLGALADQPGPLRDLYHPRRLLELVEG